MNRQSTATSTRRGIGLPGVLLVVFIVLKLTGLVNWSWVWVLAPAWITAALALAVVIIIAAIYPFIGKAKRQ